jgi:hypothetical protein
VWWASPDRWREEIVWSDDSVVRIADGNRLWQSGENHHRLESNRVARLLETGKSLPAEKGAGVSRVERKERDGAWSICLHIPLRYNFPSPVIIMGPPLPEERIVCLDASDQLPLRTEVGTLVVEVNGYAALGAKRFPRMIRLTLGRETLAETSVEVLETFDPANNAGLIMPSTAASHAWCAGMTPPRPIQFAGAANPPMIVPQGMAVVPMGVRLRGRYRLLVFQVDSAGHTLGVKAYGAGGETAMRESDREVLLKSTFHPATCRGLPVEAEFEALPTH